MAMRMPTNEFLSFPVLFLIPILGQIVSDSANSTSSSGPFLDPSRSVSHLIRKLASALTLIADVGGGCV